MKQKELALWLKVIIIGTAICGIVIYSGIIPHLLGYLVIWISSIPCFSVLVLGWLIATNIGKDKSFSKANARHLKWVSYLALMDAVYYFLVNCIFLLLDLSHPFVMGIAVIIVFVGAAISVVAAALSHLVEKASDIQEENDLTI